MGLGSTIHQSSFKRFEFFFLFFRFSWAAIPHGRIPSFFFFFDSRFHSLLNLSFFFFGWLLMVPFFSFSVLDLKLFISSC